MLENTSEDSSVRIEVHEQPSDNALILNNDDCSQSSEPGMSQFSFSAQIEVLRFSRE